MSGPPWDQRYFVGFIPLIMRNDTAGGIQRTRLINPVVVLEIEMLILHGPIMV